MIGIPDAYRGEAAKAFVKLRDGAARIYARRSAQHSSTTSSVGTSCRRRWNSAIAFRAPRLVSCRGSTLREELRSSPTQEPNGGSPHDRRRHRLDRPNADRRAFRGAFNITHGGALGGHVIKHAVSRAKVDPAEVEDVIMGCGIPEGATGGNIARVAAIRAGLPVTAAAMTVNRFCSSGLQTIALAANSIRNDGVPIAVAGGIEIDQPRRAEHEHQASTRIRGSPSTSPRSTWR